jgi:hypothetical protein
LLIQQCVDERAKLQHWLEGEKLQQELAEAKERAEKSERKAAAERERCASECDKEAKKWNAGAAKATWLSPHHNACLARAEEADDLAAKIREGGTSMVNQESGPFLGEGVTDEQKIVSLLAMEKLRVLQLQQELAEAKERAEKSERKAVAVDWLEGEKRAKLQQELDEAKKKLGEYDEHLERKLDLEKENQQLREALRNCPLMDKSNPCMWAKKAAELLKRDSNDS